MRLTLMCAPDCCWNSVTVAPPRPMTLPAAMGEMRKRTKFLRSSETATAAEPPGAPASSSFFAIIGMHVFYVADVTSGPAFITAAVEKSL